jgi:hypothetical protein
MQQLTLRHEGEWGGSRLNSKFLASFFLITVTITGRLLPVL